MIPHSCQQRDFYCLNNSDAADLEILSTCALTKKKIPWLNAKIFMIISRESLHVQQSSSVDTVISKAAKKEHQSLG